MSKKMSRRQRKQQFQPSELDKKATAKSLAKKPKLIQGVDPGVRDSFLSYTKELEKAVISQMAIPEMLDPKKPKPKEEDVIPGLPKDDQPIKLKKKEDKPFRRDNIFGYDPYSLFGSWRIGASLEPQSWVPDSFSPKDMLKEIESRPQGRFSEIEDFTHKGSQHCRCEKCGYERRALARELRWMACENRE